MLRFVTGEKLPGEIEPAVVICDRYEYAGKTLKSIVCLKLTREKLDYLFYYNINKQTPRSNDVCCSVISRSPRQT